MGRHGSTHTLPLFTQGVSVPRGTLTITGEELPNQNATVRFKISASDLPKVSSFSSVDPFILLERVQEDFGGVKVSPCFKSEVREEEEGMVVDGN